MSHPVSWQLDAHDLAPAQARALVAGLAAARRPPIDEERLDTLQLLVSELVTNAVRYGTPPITLTVTDSGTGLHVDVTDFGSPVPAQRSSPSVWSEGGRGLLLVEALANTWGTSALPDATGKSVWFEMADPVA